jgi:hypothetical protein
MVPECAEFFWLAFERALSHSVLKLIPFSFVARQTSFVTVTKPARGSFKESCSNAVEPSIFLSMGQNRHRQSSPATRLQRLRSCRHAKRAVDAVTGSHKPVDWAAIWLLG